MSGESLQEVEEWIGVSLEAKDGRVSGVRIVTCFSFFLERAVG